MDDEFNPDQLLNDIDKIMIQQGYGAGTSVSEPVEIEADNIIKPEDFKPSEEIMSRIDSVINQETNPDSVKPAESMTADVFLRKNTTVEPDPVPSYMQETTSDLGGTYMQETVPDFGGASMQEITPDADVPVQTEMIEDESVREFTPSPAGMVTDTFEKSVPVSEPEAERPEPGKTGVEKSDTSGDMFTTIEDPMEWHIKNDEPESDKVTESVEEKPPVSYLEGASSSGYQVENVAFGDISVGVETESVEYSVGHPLLRLLRNILICVAAALLLSLLITKFVAHHTAVDGSSMSTTLSDGDQLIVQQLSYYFHDPERFDIVVFPISTEDNYIKRVIGLPGETVQIIDGQVYINGSLLADDRYGLERIQDPGMAADIIYLKNDEYFVLGDNRNASVDSRFPEVGVIKKSDIKAKAWLRFYPFGDFGFVS